MLHKQLTNKIIAAFYKVYNTLGYGFLEKVYENALAHELRRQGLDIRQQMPIKVYYDGQVVGEYVADLCVERCVIVEIKAAESLCPEHEAQLLNYLRATEMEVGLLCNFGPQPVFARRILTNDRKETAPQILFPDLVKCLTRIERTRHFAIENIGFAGVH